MSSTVSSLSPITLVANNRANLLPAYNSECAGQGGKSLTLGSATGTSSPSSSTGSSSGGSSASKLGAAGKVGIPMMGVFGAGVVGGIAAFL
jgi:hypothetical protein